MILLKETFSLNPVIEYVIDNWVELTGAILSLIYLILSVRQKIGLWIFGFLCAALYVYVFFQSKFYAGMTLQFYYLAVSVYGWITWKRGKTDTQPELPVTRTSKHMAFNLLTGFLAILVIYFFILSNFTDSPLPRGDAFTTALSIVATWMLAKKLLENWLLWIVADAVSTGLYLYRGLYPTAVLFTVYTLMAVLGYFQWKKSMKHQTH